MSNEEKTIELKFQEYTKEKRKFTELGFELVICPSCNNQSRICNLISCSTCNTLICTYCARGMDGGEHLCPACYKLREKYPQESNIGYLDFRGCEQCTHMEDVCKKFNIMGVEKHLKIFDGNIFCDCFDKITSDEEREEEK